MSYHQNNSIVFKIFIILWHSALNHDATLLAIASGNEIILYDTKSFSLIGHISQPNTKKFVTFDQNNDLIIVDSAGFQKIKFSIINKLDSLDLNKIIYALRAIKNNSYVTDSLKQELNSLDPELLSCITSQEIINPTTDLAKPDDNISLKI